MMYFTYSVSKLIKSLSINQLNYDVFYLLRIKVDQITINRWLIL